MKGWSAKRIGLKKNEYSSMAQNVSIIYYISAQIKYNEKGLGDPGRCYHP